MTDQLAAMPRAPMGFLQHQQICPLGNQGLELAITTVYRLRARFCRASGKLAAMASCAWQHIEGNLLTVHCPEAQLVAKAPCLIFRLACQSLISSVCATP